MHRLITGLLMCSAAVYGQMPELNDANELTFPQDYREWIYLSSGLGMTYGPAAPGPLEDPRFDTVYVNPPAYRKFKETGTWPEGAMFVLEIRYSTSQGSINKGGYYQTDVAAIEATVKDKRFPGGWGYFEFGGGLTPQRAKSAELANRGAGCRNCHTANGAVDSTFTQFYPAALEIALAKGTVKSTYKSPTPSPVALMQMVKSQGWSAAKQTLATAQVNDPKSGLLREQSLNLVGYALLQSGDKTSSLELFRWVTEMFPTSANAYDSLAEACEVAGRNEEAVTASKKALALLSTDQSLNDRRRDLIRKALEARLAKLNSSK